METPTSNTALDHTSHIPIAKLSPNLAAPESIALKAIVTLTWPFSSATGSLAFLLSEPDFRLRRQRGQVRVQFAGSSAKRVAKSKIASGDEVILCLDGVEWIQDENKVATPGKSVEFELRFSERLLLKFNEEDSQESTIIDIDHPPLESELPVASILPDAVPDFTPLPAITTNGHATLHVVHNEVEGEYASPAFLKRARTSYGSLFELDPLEDDGTIAGKGRKRTRLSAAWTYSSRSPTPDREASDEPELPETPLNVARPMMTDEGCQTVEFELGDAAEALTTFARQVVNVGSISYRGSIIQTEETPGLQPDSTRNSMQPPAVEPHFLGSDAQPIFGPDAMPRSPRLKPLSSDLLPLVSPLISKNPAFSNTNFEFDPTSSRQNPSILDDHSIETAQEDLYSASPQKLQNAALPTLFTRPFPSAFGANGSNLLGAETLDDPETQLPGHSQSPHIMNEGGQEEGNKDFQINNDTDYGEHSLPAPLDLGARLSQYPELHEGDHPAFTNQWGSRDVPYPDLVESSVVEDDTLSYSRLAHTKEVSRSQSVRSQSQIFDLTDDSDGEQEAVQYEQQKSPAISTDIAHQLPRRNAMPTTGSKDHHEYDCELDPQNFDEEDEDEDAYGCEDENENEDEEDPNLQTDPRVRHYRPHERDIDDEELEEEDEYEMDHDGDLYAKPHLHHGSDNGYDEEEDENMYDGSDDDEEGSYDDDEFGDAAPGSGLNLPPEVIDLLSSDEEEDSALAPVAKKVDYKSAFHPDVPRTSSEKDRNSGDGSSEGSENIEPEVDSNEGGVDDERNLRSQAPNQLGLSNQSTGDEEDIAVGVKETAMRYESIREQSVDANSSVEDHNSEYRKASQSPRSSNIAVAIPSSPSFGGEDSNREIFVDQESNLSLEDDNDNENVSLSSSTSSDSQQGEADINTVGNSGASANMEAGTEEEIGTPEIDSEDQIDFGDSAGPRPHISITEVATVQEAEMLLEASSAATEVEPPHGMSSEDQIDGLEHHNRVEEEISENQEIVTLEPANSLGDDLSPQGLKDFATKLKNSFGMDGAMDDGPILDSPPLSQMFRREMNTQLPTPDNTQITHQMLFTETSLVTVTESQNTTIETQQVSTETYTIDAQKESPDIVIENTNHVAIQAPTTETTYGDERDLLADLESSLTHSGSTDVEIAESVDMVEGNSQPGTVVDVPTEDVISSEEEQQAASVVETEAVHVTENLPAGAPNDLPIEGQDVNAESGTIESIDDLIQQDLAEREVEDQPAKLAPATSPRRSQRHVKSASIDGHEQDASIARESNRDASSKDVNVATEQASLNLKPDVQQETVTVTRRSRRHKGAPIETSEEPAVDHQDASAENDVSQDSALPTIRPESEVDQEAVAASTSKKEKKGQKGPLSLERPLETEPKVDGTTIKSPRRSHRRTRSAASNSKENAKPSKVSKAQKDVSSSPSQASMPTVVDDQGTFKGHDASVELALSSLESPSKHYDLRHPLSHLTPVADLKLRLLRNLRTDLSEFTTLKMIPYYLNNKLDVLAIVTSSTPEPQRSRGGPRHYQISFHITDPSIAPNDVTEVQVFRPYKEALPVAQVGDAILLRNFTTVAVEGGFALHSDQNEASSWAVFKSDKAGVEAEMHGPPVEYGSGETTHIEELIKWFKNYDQKALAKFAKVAEKGKEAEKRKAIEPAKPTRKLRSAD